MARDVSGCGGGVVVGEPAVQGGAAQPREGAGLGLLHGLACEPETAADLLQGAWGRAVEAVAGGKDGALAWGEGGPYMGRYFQDAVVVRVSEQALWRASTGKKSWSTKKPTHEREGGQGGAHGGGKLLGLGGGGPVGVRVGEEVAQGRGLAVAHALVEGDGGGQGCGEGVHAGAGEARRGGKLAGGGRMAQGGVEGVGLAGEAGALHLHVSGDVGEGDLLGEGTAEGVLDPPHGVGGELVAARGVEEVDGAQEADGALLHEVVEGKAAVLVAPGDGDDEAPVGGDEGGAGRVAGAEGLLVERPGGQVGKDARAGVGGEGGGQEGTDDGGEDGRGEGQTGEEGGEDGGGGGAGGDGGGQVAAQAHGKVALGQQAGAAAGADQPGQVALLGGGEHGGRGDGRRDHTGSCVVQGLYPERTRPTRVPDGPMGIRGAAWDHVWSHTARRCSPLLTTLMGPRWRS